MANISIVFKESDGMSELEVFPNKKNEITVAVYGNGERQIEYSGLISLDLETAKLFAKELNRAIKLVANERV
jgi:hypothetical protein